MKAALFLFVLLSLGFLSVGQNVVQAEYFIDTDAGVGNNRVLNLQQSPDGVFPLTVDLNGVAPGNHLLYMRTKDESGVWSHAMRKHIEVVPLQSPAQIVAGEYFFDLDPGVGAGSAIVISPQDSLVLQHFNANVSGLSPGPHRLYTRVKDNYGKWSILARGTIEVLPAESHQLVHGEYYFNNDPGFGQGNAMVISPQDSAATQQFTASTAGLAPGHHVLYERIADSYGKWSQTSRRFIEVVKSPDTSLIVSFEYFFNSDPGIGNARRIVVTAPLQNGEFSFTIPPGELPSVIDTLFIRAGDSSDFKWSHTTWRVASEGALPLTLLNFSAALEHHSVNLRWQTEQEINTAFFNVQRSVDGIQFTNLGKVGAKGNSIAKSDYNYTDQIAGLHSNRLYYRLEQADRDGAITYSNIVSVEVGSTNARFRIMPNPASDYITIIPGSGLNTAPATLLISTLSGHTLLKQQLSGAMNQKVNLASFAKGVYMISFITPGNIQTEQLVIR